MCKKLLSFIFSIAALSSTTGFAKNTVRFSTLDWEPYIGEKLEKQGFVAEIVRQAYAKVGYDVKIEFYPWERALQMAKTGECDGLLPEYMSPERKADFNYSNEFSTGPVGLMKLKSRKDIPAIKKTVEIKPYSLGLVEGYVNTDEIDKAKDLKKETVSSDELNLQKLIAGRIDLVFIDKYVGEFILKTSIKDSAGKVEFIEPPLETKPLYIVFTKAKKELDKKREDFNKGLKLLKDSGEFDAILKKFKIK